MRRMISIMKASLLVAAAIVAVLARPAGAADETLLARMSALNPSLRDFTANLHADVTMKSFPFLSAQLAGTYYFKQPDKTKVVFSSGLPLVAQQFDKLYAHIESPSQWDNVYVVTVVSDNGSTTTFKLVPRKDGNVDHIDAIADDKTATVTSMRWSYKNGGYAEMSNRYGQVDGNTLVVSQTGHVEEPGYVADITSTIDGYKINPPLDDGVFSGQ
jgi:outer membrane lipoprotein-sorting protein